MRAAQSISWIAYAIEYARRGWPVFPLHGVLSDGQCTCGKDCGNPGKHPRTKNGFKDATTDENQIRRWGRMWQTTNVGVATGDKSGLLVIDIDPRSGGDKTWNDLVMACDDIPPTIIVATGGGGHHVYFAIPKGIGVIKSKADGLGKGVDIKCVGGYVVAPPSNHNSGLNYKFSSSLNDVDLAIAPSWLIERITIGQQQQQGKMVDSWLLTAFQAAGMTGHRMPNRSVVVQCPWNNSHTTGRAKDGSTVVFPPSPGKTRGWFHCSHAHCSNRTQDDVIGALPKSAIDAANFAFPITSKKHATHAEGPPPNTEWESELVRKDDGSVMSILPNVVSILVHDSRWKDVLVYDEFRQKAIFLTTPPWHPDDAGSCACTCWTDEDVHRLKCWFSRFWAMNISTESANGASMIVARKHSIDSAKDYLHSLKWDAIERLPKWLHMYLGTEDTPYASAIGMRWLIQLAARALNPGCKADSVLVLEGEQGTLKSTALRVLVGDDFFSDEISDISNKDAAIDLQGKLLIELGEMSAIKRSSREAWKAFIARSVDHYRPPYGRVAVDIPRRCVFAATTNDYDYITDESGARRNWGIRIGTINLEKLKQNKELLLAEAVARFESDEQWWLTQEEAALHAVEQNDRCELDPWGKSIEDYVTINNKESVTIQEILGNVLSIEKGQRKHYDSRRVAAVLRKLGFTFDGRKGGRGAQVRVYVR